MEIKSEPIHGVEFVPLKKLQDERGMVLHMLSCLHAHFEGFGEVYLSFTNPGVIKGWKCHKEMKQNFVVPVGRMKFVFYDQRLASPTRGAVCVLEGSLEPYGLIRVPAGVWYSFQCLSLEPALIVNCATLPHDPKEVEQRPLTDSFFPAYWSSQAQAF